MANGLEPDHGALPLAASHQGSACFRLLSSNPLTWAWAQLGSNQRPLACKAKTTAESCQLLDSDYWSELLRLCRKMPGGAWKSVHGGSRKWLPKQCQDRDGSAAVCSHSDKALPPPLPCLCSRSFGHVSGGRGRLHVGGRGAPGAASPGRLAASACSAQAPPADPCFTGVPACAVPPGTTPLLG